MPWGDRAHVNALGAFLVSTCGVPLETAGQRACEMIALAKELAVSSVARCGVEPHSSTPSSTPSSAGKGA